MRPLKICVPYLGKIETKTEACIRELMATDLGREKYLHLSQGSDIAMMRNSFITKSRMIKQPDPGVDFLFIDSDMVFTVKDVKDLMSTESLFVGAAYQRQGDPSKMMAGDWDHLGGTSALWDWEGTIGNGEVECDFVAPGLSYLRGEVIPMMVHPYFRHKLLKYGDQMTETQEDVGFCYELAKSGIKPKVNLDIRVLHIQRDKISTQKTHRRLMNAGK